MANKIPPRRVPRDRFIQRGGSSGGGIFGGASIPGAHTHVEADITDLGAYLELTGGTLSGNLLVNDADNVFPTDLPGLVGITVRTTPTAGNIVTGLWIQGNEDQANYDAGIAIQLGNWANSNKEFTSRIVHYGRKSATLASQLAFDVHTGGTSVWWEAMRMFGDTKRTELHEEFRLLDASGADWAAWTHDGTNLNLDFTNTTDYNITGVFLKLNIEANSNSILAIGEVSTLRGDAQNSHLLLFGEIGGVISTASIVNIGSALEISIANHAIRLKSNTQVRGGKHLRVQDSGDTDFGTWTHDGTDFNLILTNTADYNITGLTGVLKLVTPIRIQSGGASASGGDGLLQLSKPTDGANAVELLRFRLLGATNNPTFIVEAQETAHTVTINASGSTGNAKLILATMGNDRATLNNIGLALVNGIAVHGATVSSTKPTVTGSAAGNAALASLLTALANYGLITDSSS